MKEKYLCPSIINAEILEFEGAFPAKAIEAISKAAAKVLNAVFQTAQMKKNVVHIDSR